MRAILVFAVLLQLVFCCSAWALDAGGDGFPGKGDHASWLKANEIYNQGVDFKRSGQYQAAVEKYLAAIKVYPYDPGYYSNLGNAYRKLKQYPLAEQMYKKSIDLDGSLWNPWMGLGNVYSDMGRDQESLAAFRKSLSLQPSEPFKKAIQSDVARLEKHLVTR
jgi:tetratricopeptide (TPR) repeat protein